MTEEELEAQHREWQIQDLKIQKSYVKTRLHEAEDEIDKLMRFKKLAHRIASVRMTTEEVIMEAKQAIADYERENESGSVHRVVSF